MLIPRMMPQSTVGPPRLLRPALAGSAAILILALFFARLGHRELTSSHEARAAQNAQRMLDTGEWGLPVLFDGRRDLQKPPGYYWMAAAAGSLNGGVVDEWITRLPAALTGLLCVVMVLGFLRQEGRPRAAIVAALVLATANHFTGIARTARIDIPLTFAVAAALMAFYKGCHPESIRSALAWHGASAIAAALAALLKGPVALALIGPAALAWIILERPRVPRCSWALIPAMALAIAVPWFIWANSATGGEFFRVFFWHHTIARFAGSSPQLATHPWWYYAPRFAIDFLPWTPVLAGLVVWSARTGHARADRHFRFALIVCASMAAVLSAARFKRADYLLPLYPFAAIAVGCAAEAWAASRVHPATLRRARWAFSITLILVAAGWAGMVLVIEPRQQAKDEQRRFAAAIRAAAPAPQTILQFRMESHLLSYHLGRPVHTLVEWGELNERLAGPGPHFVVMPPENVFAAGQIVTSRKLVPITRLEDHTSVTPSRPLVLLRTAD